MTQDFYVIFQLWTEEKTDKPGALTTIVDLVRFYDGDGDGVVAYEGGHYEKKMC